MTEATVQSTHPATIPQPARRTTSFVFTRRAIRRCVLLRVGHHNRGNTQLVPIVIRLVRTLDRDSDVIGLVPGQLGQLDAEMIEMLEASRQYSNMVEAMSTAKQLMLETMRMK